MEQEGDGEGGDVSKKPQPQPPPPQTCPRCESVNTKFCYYNNYSLSQPRYFCKTCRRYWTQGGTLRNVPVGGGCRKGKRARTSSSSQLKPPPQEAVVPAQRNLTRTTVIRPKDPPAALGSPSPSPSPSILPYPQVGGYLSSLAAIQSLNPSQPFNPSLNLGADAVGSGSSNLRLLSGFNAASLGSQRQIRPSEIFQIENREREIESLYRAEQGSSSHHGWSQSFINNASHMAPDASLWCTMSTTSIGDHTSGINNNTAAASSSVIPNQWPDLPGFCPPP